MVLTTKHRMIIYRRFRRDVWGYGYTDLRRYVELPTRSQFTNYFKKVFFPQEFFKLPYFKYDLFQKFITAKQDLFQKDFFQRNFNFYKNRTFLRAFNLFQYDLFKDKPILQFQKLRDRRYYNQLLRKFDKVEDEPTLRLNKLNIHLLKSPYLKYFYDVWWRRRKSWRRNQKRYVYKFDRPTAFRKWRKYNKRFLSIRLTRLYYLTFQDHQYRKMFRLASKMDGILKLIICAF